MDKKIQSSTELAAFPSNFNFSLALCPAMKRLNYFDKQTIWTLKHSAIFVKAPRTLSITSFGEVTVTYGRATASFKEWLPQPPHKKPAYLLTVPGINLLKGRFVAALIAAHQLLIAKRGN